MSLSAVNRCPTCVVPRTYSSYGDRTFAAAGPRLSNSLPVQLRNPDISYRRFRRQLKGHLSGNDEHGALTLDMQRRRKTFYLLTYMHAHIRNASLPNASYMQVFMTTVWQSSQIRKIRELIDTHVTVRWQTHLGEYSPLTSTWPHLRCDVGLEEGEYK